jgi:hypothetical protein
MTGTWGRGAAVVVVGATVVVVVGATVVVVVGATVVVVVGATVVVVVGATVVVVATWASIGEPSSPVPMRPPAAVVLVVVVGATVVVVVGATVVVVVGATVVVVVGATVVVVGTMGGTEGPLQALAGAAAAGELDWEITNVDAPASNTAASPAWRQRARTVLDTSMHCTLTRSTNVCSGVAFWRL